MTVLIVYVALVAVCETIVFFLGVTLDSVIPSGWNIISAMVLFFGALWAMWPVAVFITERWLTQSESPKGAKPAR